MSCYVIVDALARWFCAW